MADTIISSNRILFTYENLREWDGSILDAESYARHVLQKAGKPASSPMHFPAYRIGCSTVGSRFSSGSSSGLGGYGIDLI